MNNELRATLSMKTEQEQSKLHREAVTKLM